jgi:hypothetical protein
MPTNKTPLQPLKKLKKIIDPNLYAFMTWVKTGRLAEHPKRKSKRKLTMTERISGGWQSKSVSSKTRSV